MGAVRIEQFLEEQVELYRCIRLLWMWKGQMFLPDLCPVGMLSGNVAVAEIVALEGSW